MMRLKKREQAHETAKNRNWGSSRGLSVRAEAEFDGIGRNGAALGKYEEDSCGLSMVQILSIPARMMSRVCLATCMKCGSARK